MAARPRLSFHHSQNWDKFTDQQNHSFCFQITICKCFIGRLGRPDLLLDNHNQIYKLFSNKCARFWNKILLIITVLWDSSVQLYSGIENSLGNMFSHKQIYPRNIPFSCQNLKVIRKLRIFRFLINSPFWNWIFMYFFKK